MGVIYRVDPDRPDEAALAAAEEAIEAGDLVILPTETVYGLAARPDRSEATARVFEAKGRPASLNLPVLAPTVQAAWEIGRPGETARRLAAAFWPGPLTLVLPRTERSRSWTLGNRRDSVAVRVPDHVLARALLERTGPLAATSANRSGRPPLERPDQLVGTFHEQVAVFILSSEPGLRAGVPSTVVDAAGDPVRILRPGALDPEAVRRALLEGQTETGE